MVQLIEELDSQGKVAFSKTKDDNQQKKGAKFKVTLGVMPDYVYEGEGMRIDAVIEDRTAYNAGIQDGDIVIQIGTVEVKEIYSYMKALSQYEKGSKAVVKVKRGETILEKEVTF